MLGPIQTKAFHQIYDAVTGFPKEVANLVASYIPNVPPESVIEVIHSMQMIKGDPKYHFSLSSPEETEQIIENIDLYGSSIIRPFVQINKVVGSGLQHKLSTLLFEHMGLFRNLNQAITTLKISYPKIFEKPCETEKLRDLSKIRLEFLEMESYGYGSDALYNASPSWMCNIDFYEIIYQFTKIPAYQAKNEYYYNCARFWDSFITSFKLREVMRGIFDIIRERRGYINLDGQDLNNTDWSFFNLDYISAKSAKFMNSCFYETSARYADFSGAQMWNVRLYKSLFSYSKFIGGVFNAPTISQSNFQCSDFTRARLSLGGYVDILKVTDNNDPEQRIFNLSYNLD